MGLALAAVSLQPLNTAPGLTTMPTHKAGAEIAPFVCIDESAVSALTHPPAAQPNTQAEDEPQITT